MTVADRVPFTFPNASRMPPAWAYAEAPGARARVLTQRSPDRVACTDRALPFSTNVSATETASPSSAHGRNEQVKQNHSSFAGSAGAAGSR